MKQDRTIKLRQILDLDAGQALLGELKGKLASGEPLCLDASGVEVMSLPGVQIVLAAIRSQSKVSVLSPSPVFIAAFTDHGISWESEAAATGADQPPAEEPEAAPAAAATVEPPAAAAEPDPEPLPMKRILTIDDSKTMRDMLMLTLSNSGFEVLQAVDGLDGLDVLGRETVDVVITDINMPKLDGYGVIQHMRERPEYDDLPILVLTTESDQEKKERARKLGATGFIIKPFNPTGLVDVLRKVAA
ncbi:chemotaxis response regulator receiver CheYI [Rhodoplanes sp. Z2-YC6860]|nr:chemotaxis response regulator receiver CheYI [Rhodoplanes sp. Z2-YC6860]